MIFGKKFDVDKIRNDFSVLQKNTIIYLDSACMSLKPRQVIDKMNEYYNGYPACSGRSYHKFGVRVGDEIASARTEIRKFICAGKDEEIIFTKNTTEGLNLVINGLNLKDGDEVIISDKEHNSNLIPLLRLKDKARIKIVVCATNKDGTFNIENFKRCFSGRTKLISIVWVSNLDGVENPIKEIIKIAHSNNALVLIDGAQGVPHKEIDVSKLGVDFLAFSGHKMLGPSGTGILYGKKELLEKIEGLTVGGGTVVDSNYDGFEFEKSPAKFEAGLQNYSGIIGLGETCKYLKKIGLKNISEHEEKLMKIVFNGLKDISGLEIIGPTDAEKRGGVFSFNIVGMSSHDVAKILDSSRAVMIRSGAHCVHSWFNKHKINGCARASFYLYNTEEEARTFVEEVKKIAKFGK